MRLHTLVPQQLWHAQQKLRFGPIELATRMTVVRLHDGSLWVHSPIQPTQELLAQLQSQGPVRQVVAPNRSHHLFFLPFVWAHPGAQGWIAPGLAEQHPSLAAYPSLGTPAPWHAELQPYPIHGLPQLNETVFFHPASGTLILTDLLFCIGPQPSALARGLARLLGIYGRVAMSRSMRLLVQDPAALAASVAPLLALPVQRLILAHDQIIEHDALAQWQQAWRWLLPPVTP